MRFHPRATGLWQSFVMGILFSIWFGLFGILMIAHGDVETLLHNTFRNSSRDAFYDLNRVIVHFCGVHSSLTIIAVAAARSRRSDVFAVLLIGPAIGLVINLLSQRWGDPNWAVIAGVCVIGWLVSTIVGGASWFMTSMSVRHGVPPQPGDSTRRRS